MNLKLIESFVELVELGAFANKEDIAKGLKSAIKVTKESAELTDEEINDIAQECWVYPKGEQAIFNQHKFAKAILRKAQEKC